MIELNLKIIKQVYYDWESEYKVLSCIPLESDKIEVNKYGNFTISGNNLEQFDVGEEYQLKLKPDENSKYPASYVVVGFEGIDYELDTNTIVVSDKAQLSILKRLMTKSQAENVTKAYPNFVQKVLRGEENDIDFNNIYNVGKVRIEDYIDKVKSNCRSLLFYPICDEWNISSPADFSTIIRSFNFPNELKIKLENSPYSVLVGMLNHTFNKADKYIISKMPRMIDSVERCEYACREILKENEEQGDTRLNANILSKFVKELTPECHSHIVEAVTNSKTIHYEPERKYAALKSTYEAEKYIAKDLKQRLEDDFSDYEYLDPISNQADFYNIDGFELSDEQKQMLHLASEKRVSMLIGNAGSGKTSTMKALVRMLENNERSYTLLAPTGVAAKRLKEVTGRNTSTIHRALMLGALRTDYIIIDESSMLSVQLLYDLLTNLRIDIKIIFIADEAQLASISCGNVVQDLIDSGIIPYIKLTKIFRYGIGGIATISTDIRNGISESLIKDFEDYHFIPAEKNLMEQITENYENLLKKGYSINDIMVICPFNKSKIGTYTINQTLQNRFNPSDDTGISYKRGSNIISFKVNDRVLNTKNNYRMPVMEYDEDMNLIDTMTTTFIANGDIGVIRDYKHDENGTWLLVQFDTALVKIEGSDISELLLGYSLSCHKVQGSQAPAIIAVVTKEHKNMLSRNLMYVATSRAQKEMLIIGDEDAIIDGLEIEENKERDTYLVDFLQGVISCKDERSYFYGTIGE